MTLSAEPVVEHADGEHRYEIRVGGELAGFTQYLDRGAQRVFYHTEIDDAFTGRGLAARLVRDALTDARDAGKRVVPVCSYVAGFVRRHDEFSDVTDHVTKDVLEWLRAALD